MVVQIVEPGIQLLRRLKVSKRRLNGLKVSLSSINIDCRDDRGERLCDLNRAELAAHLPS